MAILHGFEESNSGSGHKPIAVLRCSSNAEFVFDTVTIIHLSSHLVALLIWVLQKARKRLKTTDRLRVSKMSFIKCLGVLGLTFKEFSRN